MEPMWWKMRDIVFELKPAAKKRGQQKKASTMASLEDGGDAPMGENNIGRTSTSQLRKYANRPFAKSKTCKKRQEVRLKKTTCR